MAEINTWVPGSPGNPEIVLVDPDRYFLRDFSAVLQGLFEVVGRFSEEDEARRGLASRTPDIALVNLKTGEPGEGLELIRWIALEFPQVVVLALSDSWSLESLREVLSAGARGFLLKPLVVSELLAAVSFQLAIQHDAKKASSPRAQEIWTLRPSSPDSGQTTFACSLASSLSREGHRVLLVELSSGRSEAGDLLGLPKAYPTMDVVLESLDLMRPALAAETLLRVPGGFQLLPLGKAPVDTRTALSLLLALGDLVDYVLVDVPYSKRDAWTSLLPLSRRVLVTGEGSSTGLSRLRGELEELGEMDIDQRVMPVLTRCVEDPEIEGGFLALLEDLPLHLGNTLPRVSPEAPRKLACGEFHESGDPGEYALRLQQISLPLLRAQASSKVVRALSEPPFRPSSGPGIGRWGPGKVNASRETGPG